MPRDFNKQDVLDIALQVESVLKKLNICISTKNQLQDIIVKSCKSDILIKKCISFMSKDFSEHAPITTVDDVVLSCKELFGNLYLKTKFQAVFDEIDNIEHKYGNILSMSITDAQYAADGFTWMFAPKSTKENVINGYANMRAFMESDVPARIDVLFDTLKDNKPCSDNELLRAYNEHSQEWFNYIHQLVNFDSVKQSNYVGNSKSRVSRFEAITHNPLTEEAFECEFDKYRDYVRDLVVQETTIDVIVDIYQELEKLPIEEINRDKSGFRVSLLQSNGFNTLADIYRAKPSSLSTIKGISKDTAFKIKHKVDEIASLLQEKRTTTEPLQINYDNHSKHVTNIVRAAYACKRLLVIRKRFRHMAELDFDRIEKAITILSRFNYDIDWLFYTDKRRSNIIKAYEYLGELRDNNSYKNCLYFDKYAFANLNSVSASAAWDEFKDNAVAYYNCIEFLVPDAFESVAFGYGLPEELAEQIEKQVIYPKGLTCELRRYQIWGVKYILHQGRVLLGDEMGLGKTIQAIATMVSLKNVGYKHFIVICPASVVINWFKEVRQHSKLQSYVGHGTAKERNDAVKQWKYDGGVLVTTYETYSNLHIDNLNEVGLVTVDEAHYIKNPQATRSKNIRALCGQVKRVLFLTGTPIENKVEEMLSLLSVLNEDVANNARTYAQISTSQQFKDVVAPVYFRRKQCDVNKELPEKIEKIAWCEMNPEEIKAYDAAVLNSQNPFMPMRQVSWNLDVSWSSKAKALKDIVDETVADNRKLIVFSFFKQPIERVCRLFAGHCAEPIDGSISPAKRQEIIDNFTQNPNLYILPSQIQAGGTGLNIQAASVVVMCEPQIKPSIENQAIARAHRMGQSRSVIVYRLCCKDSIDERMLEILDRKKEEFEVFADRSVAGDKSLDLNENDTAVKDAIAEEIRIIKARNGIKSDTNSFKKSSEGKEWNAEQRAIGQIQYKKIENRGRQRTVTASQRYRILNRDHFTCQKCGAKGPGAGGTAELEVDHKIPFSLGGTDDDDNLWTLCKKCNGGKSNNYVD